MRDADRGSARAGVADRGGGPAARRGPARRQDVRADRDAARADPRAGDRDDHRRRRAGHGLGVAQDRLRRGRRERRARSSPRPSASGCRCWTRRGCATLLAWLGAALSRRTSRARRPSKPRPRARSRVAETVDQERERERVAVAAGSSRRGSRRLERAGLARGSRPGRPCRSTSSWSVPVSPGDGERVDEGRVRRHLAAAASRPGPGSCGRARQPGAVVRAWGGCRTARQLGLGRPRRRRRSCRRRQTGRRCPSAASRRRSCPTACW